MRDFPDLLPYEKAGVFLIRAPHNLTAELLEKIKNRFNRGEIISFERLFKGSKSALVVFGPRSLTDFSELSLLELEDYSYVDPESVSVWDVVLKGGEIPDNIFADLPSLNVDDQFWWQLALRVRKGEFQTEIRSVVYTQDIEWRKELASKLQNLADGKLVKLPKPLTPEQQLGNYQKRIIVPLAKDQLILGSAQIFKLLGKV